MKLTKKFIQQTNHFYTSKYDPEWKEFDHFKTRQGNHMFYNGHAVDSKHHEFLGTLSRKPHARTVHISVLFDKHTYEYVEAKVWGVKRKLTDDETNEMMELVMSYFVEMFKRGYLTIS